ncbi:PrsW family glutamic-type intramembrane protease [Bacillus sp. EB600]|uniref:PrsW family glutamic-type intramembrane protease n=1 Tax=Bacillus sp. EB600 TaxID=2806345 RepID=UPI00210EE2D7|nr:PrsW family glutamic-type intramembrane protease [Bacillus sp. EB600]MCQ6280035.1 PrsW family intramembrane metalloprotease [Bacillus sp. EB600]
MNCVQCGTVLPNKAKLCSNCGNAVVVYEGHTANGGPEKSLGLSDIANKINAVAGINTPLDIKFKEIFSNVFVKHTEGDAEELFFVGTAKTTPNIENIVDSWPRPWLFARIFLVVGLLYFGLYIGVKYFQNINFLPGLITMGSFMVPLTMLMFFWEMNVPQNISIYKVVKILFGGGILSLITAIFIYKGFADSTSVIVIGVVEEFAKLLVIVWFLRNRNYNYIFNGLLIGAAVGAGFAAFESAGYALKVAMISNMDNMYSTIFWRGVLAPGGHIVWAALSGAAICMVKGNKDFQWSMLKDIRFLRIFVIVVFLHALWDVPWSDTMGIPFPQIIFTIVSWIIALGVMNTGLKEISSLKEQTLHRHASNLSPSEIEQLHVPS